MLIRVVLRPMSNMLSFACRLQGLRVALGAVPRPLKFDIFWVLGAHFLRVSTLRAVNAQRKCVVLKRGVGGWEKKGNDLARHHFPSKNLRK